jgi:hypothetical protein
MMVAGGSSFGGHGMRTRRGEPPPPGSTPAQHPRAPRPLPRPHLFWYDRMTLTASYSRSGGMPGPFPRRAWGALGRGGGSKRIHPRLCFGPVPCFPPPRLPPLFPVARAPHHFLGIQQRQHHRRLEALAAAVTDGPPGRGEGGEEGGTGARGGGVAVRSERFMCEPPPPETSQAMLLASRLPPARPPVATPPSFSPGCSRPRAPGQRAPPPASPQPEFPPAPAPPSPVVPAAEGPRALADVAVVALQGRLRLLDNLGGGGGGRRGEGVSRGSSLMAA